MLTSLAATAGKTSLLPVASRIALGALAAGGLFTIQSNGSCFDLRAADTTDFSPVIYFPCNGGVNQLVGSCHITLQNIRARGLMSPTSGCSRCQRPRARSRSPTRSRRLPLWRTRRQARQRLHSHWLFAPALPLFGTSYQCPGLTFSSKHAHESICLVSLTYAILWQDHGQHNRKCYHRI